ncbi:HNH endonuclease, partial [Actinomycetes bacterium M1A6_2h]
PGPDGERDPRPPAQRTADALATLLDRNFTGTGRPTFAGTIDLAALTRRDPADTSTRPGGTDSADSPSPDTGHVPTDSEPWLDGNGLVPPAFTTPPTDWPFQLGWSGPISQALALLVTCDAQLNPIVVDGAGVPLAMGRTVRTVTAEQRTAVTVRDHSCIMCGRPPQWCQVHHLTHWAHGGPTDLDNLALLCGECHRQVHQHGHEIVLGTDRYPRIIPPATFDATRKPRETHHRQHRRRAA